MQRGPEYGPTLGSAAVQWVFTPGLRGHAASAGRTSNAGQGSRLRSYWASPPSTMCIVLASHHCTGGSCVQLGRPSMLSWRSMSSRDLVSASYAMCVWKHDVSGDRAVPLCVPCLHSPNLCLCCCHHEEKASLAYGLYRPQCILGVVVSS